MHDKSNAQFAPFKNQTRLRQVMIDFRLIKVIVKTTKCQTDNAIWKDDTYRLSRKTALREKGATRMNANF